MNIPLVSILGGSPPDASISKQPRQQTSWVPCRPHLTSFFVLPKSQLSKWGLALGGLYVHISQKVCAGPMAKKLCEFMGFQVCTWWRERERERGLYCIRMYLSFNQCKRAKKPSNSVQSGGYFLVGFTPKLASTTPTWWMGNYVWDEPAVSYRWTGRVRELPSWSSSRLQEMRRSFTRNL